MASTRETFDAVQFWLVILAAAGMSIVAGRAAGEFSPVHVLGRRS